MSAFARSACEQLTSLIHTVDADSTFDVVRPAEHGSVMVRGRAGGTGQLFNVGEMTVTRCTVRSHAGAVGHGYVAGRNSEHAEAAARLDAVFQELDPDRAEPLVIELERAIAERSRAQQQKSAPTRVDFFTMARGENE